MKTLRSRSRASLCFVTLADHRFDDFFRVLAIVSYPMFRSKQIEWPEFFVLLRGIVAGVGGPRSMVRIANLRAGITDADYRCDAYGEDDF